MTPQPPAGPDPTPPTKAAPSTPESRPFPFPPGWNTAQPARRKWPGFLGAITTAVAIVIFVGSLMLNVYYKAVSPSGDDDQIDRKTIVDGDAKQIVAVVPIETALMTDKTARDFEAVMKEVDADANVKAVVLRIDTPGGEVTAADEIHYRIETYRTKHPGIPVVVSMGGMATSGGYYAACAGDHLFAEPTTLTGNIGVLLPQYNFAKLAEKYGVEDDTIHSTGADYKTAGSPLRQPTDQETAYLTHLIDEDAKQFHSVVKKGRAGKLTKPEAELFNGQAYSGEDAVTAGLIDEIGRADAAYKYAAGKAGLASMKVVRFEIAEPFLRSLISSSAIIGRPSGHDGIHQISVGGQPVSAPLLDLLLDGRPLYYFHPSLH